MGDYYKLLGVSKEADVAEIKKNYRKLSRQCHPDLNPDNPEAEEKFKKISEAYSVLSNNEKRRQYDDMRTSGAPPPGFHHPGGFPGFESIFEQFFGARHPRPGPPPRREPPSVNFRVPIEKLLKQPEIKSYFSLKREVICEACSGIGGEFAEPCPACGGAGAVESMRSNGNVTITTTHPCVTCKGSGKHYESPCSECGTAGVKEAVQRYEVKMRCKEIK